jgi:DNA polymerase III alpha subunit
VAPVLQLPYVDAAPLDEKIAWEEELLGTAVSRHPIADLAPTLRAANAVPVGEVTGEQDAQRVAAGGVVRRLRSFSTKDGRPMATFQLADLRASIEVVVFSRSYEQIGLKLTEGATLVIEGKIDASDGRLRLLASNVHTLEEIKETPLSPSSNGKKSSRSEPGAWSESNGSAPATLDRPPKRITIELRRGTDRSDDIARVLAIYELLQRYPGQDDIEILVRQGGRVSAIPLPNKSVGYCDRLAAQLAGALDGAVIRVDGEPVTV